MSGVAGPVAGPPKWWPSGRWWDGAGVTTKLVNNLVSTAICALTGEGMAIGAAAGLDPEVLLAVMANTAANSNHLGNAILNRVLTGDFSPNFKLSLAYKDLGLATALAASLGVPSLMGVHRRAGSGHDGERSGLALSHNQGYPRHPERSELANEVEGSRLPNCEQRSLHFARTSLS